MKNIKITTIKDLVKNLLIEANFILPPDIKEAVGMALAGETSPTSKKILEMILENAEIARREKLPLCQDCGTVYVDIAIGNNICIENSGILTDEINMSVSEIYETMHLRKSIVSDPLFERKNTSNNTPAIIHTFYSADYSADHSSDYNSDNSAESDKSNEIGIEVSLKGGGSENCSYLHMVNPSSSKSDIENIILETIKCNVTKCCPPVIAGIGIGTTASEVTGLARKAAYRNLGKRNSDPKYAALEEELLLKINATGIGPQGLGGKTTALACNIEFAPCHMATLPVAIFLGCHSTRRAFSKISPP